jgi:hypothetical protein
MALKYSVVTGGVEHLDDKKEIVVFMGVFGGCERCMFHQKTDISSL